MWQRGMAAAVSAMKLISLCGAVAACRLALHTCGCESGPLNTYTNMATRLELKAN